MADGNLDDARREAADELYEGFDFGWQVKDANGWEFDDFSNEWTRVVFLENEDQPGGDSVKGSFTVHFDPGTADPNHAYANVQGTVIDNGLPAGRKP